MGKFIDLTNKRFGRLVVIKRIENRVYGNKYIKTCWECACDCGNTITATTQDLRKGDVLSCGCLKIEKQKERLTVHGEHDTKLHNIWCAMRRRCNNVNNKDYKYYGGRGIHVCNEWIDNYIEFNKWARASGYKYGLTIDRIDTNGDYCPNNCRWISIKDQCNNRRSNKLVTYKGETHTIKEWSEKCNIPYSRLYMRIRNGWSFDRAIDNCL